MNVPTGVSGLVGAEFRGLPITDVEVDWDRFVRPAQSVRDVLVDLSAIPENPRSEPSRCPDRLHR